LQLTPCQTKNKVLFNLVFKSLRSTNDIFILDELDHYATKTRKRHISQKLPIVIKKAIPCNSKCIFYSQRQFCARNGEFDTFTFYFDELSCQSFPRVLHQDY